MEPGLWIYDADGVTVRFGPSTSNVTVLGVVDTGKSNGSISHPLFAKGRPVVVDAVALEGSTFTVPDIVILPNNVLSWSFKTSGANWNEPVRITYGVRA